MPRITDTALYARLLAHLQRVRMVDTHEHLQQADQFAPADEVDAVCRFFNLLTSSDLKSAGLPSAEWARAVDPRNGLDTRARWALLEPWYRLTWNTHYFEVLRIAARDLYGVEEFTADGLVQLTEAMRRVVKPGLTRAVFDRANIDFAMNNPFGPQLVFRPTPEPETFLIDMHDQFTEFPIAGIARDAGIEIGSLADYFRAIDIFFDRYGAIAGAYKVGRAYDRILAFDDVPPSAVEGIFRQLCAGDRPDPLARKALEDCVLHYLCRKCGDYGLRMKYHTGHQEGNNLNVTHARAALLINLFQQYPDTNFDIYHISYPYHEEAASLAKTFPNVTINFCFAFVVNPVAARAALAGMLDTVPVGKIHGYGGDYLCVEGSYAAAVVTRREIARVLAEKVLDGRFSEEQAADAGTMILRDNALRNFNLPTRRAAYARWVKETYGATANS